MSLAAVKFTALLQPLAFILIVGLGPLHTLRQLHEYGLIAQRALHRLDGLLQDLQALGQVVLRVVDQGPAHAARQRAQLAQNQRILDEVLVTVA